MNTMTLRELNKIKPQKIGKMPVVVLPLDYFERLKENMEMHLSKKLPKEIAKSREEIKNGKFLSLYDVKKRLKLA